MSNGRLVFSFMVVISLLLTIALVAVVMYFNNLLKSIPVLSTESMSPPTTEVVDSHLSESFEQLKQEVEELRSENERLKNNAYSPVISNDPDIGIDVDNDTSIYVNINGDTPSSNGLSDSSNSGNSVSTSEHPKVIDIPVSFIKTLYDVSHRSSGDSSASNDIRVREYITMGGNTYDDAITYRIGGGDSSKTLHSLHNLEGKYTTLTGYIGRVDEWNEINGTFNFYFDGRLKQSYELKATDLPTQISIDVTDVLQLKVEFVSVRQHPGTTYAFVGDIY